MTRILTMCTLLMGCAGVAMADDGGMSTCTTISQPGYYHLVSNITATGSNVQPVSGANGSACIAIKANNVTLDLAGHNITAIAGLSGYLVVGIFANTSGVEIRNGLVTGFDLGVELTGNLVRVENVRSFSNLTTNIFVGGSGSMVVGNTTSGATYGIVVSCPALVLENASTGNSYSQILAQGAGCTLNNNVPSP
jgi:hypothetical protein